VSSGNACACGAQFAHRLSLAMRDDKLTHNRRENEKTHGDQAKPCRRKGPSVSIHISWREVSGVVRKYRVLYMMQFNIRSTANDRAQANRAEAKANQAWRSSNSGELKRELTLQEMEGGARG
jgi:hypothetical protein